MATTKSTRNPTLADLVGRLGPDNKYMEIAEVLNETNEMLDDITEYERYCETHPGYRNSKAGMAISGARG